MLRKKIAYIGDGRSIVRAEFRLAHVRLEWKPQDAWIGVFWRKERWEWHTWICILPMLPIHIIVPRSYEDIDAENE